jgi:hypothetical protein
MHEENKYIKTLRLKIFILLFGGNGKEDSVGLVQNTEEEVETKFHAHNKIAGRIKVLYILKLI